MLDDLLAAMRTMGVGRPFTAMELISRAGYTPTKGNTTTSGSALKFILITLPFIEVDREQPARLRYRVMKVIPELVNWTVSARSLGTYLESVLVESEYVD